MLRKEYILTVLRSKESEFKTRFGVTKLGLFGSFANGTNDAESDVDVLIEFAPGISALRVKKATIKSELEDAFDRPVDLCREKFINALVKDLILQDVVYV